MEGQPWGSMGLVRDRGRHDRFSCTDNLTGWFEGFTHSRSLGQGYMVRDTFVFQSWSSTVGKKAVNREAALTDTVFPWGHRLEYRDGTVEELLLHSGRRLLSVRVTTTKPSSLAIQATLATPLPAGLSVSRVEHRTPTSLTVHWAFGESPEETADNQAWAKKSSVWEQEIEARWRTLTKAWLTTNDQDYNKALFWATASARSFVTQEFGTGLWAGLPWFKDNWGRDTFIALPGTLLCTGDFTTARDVLQNFARYQNGDATDRNRGRIPNRVNAHEILYNTVDGTPWLIRELDEYLRHTGDHDFAQALRPLVRLYVEGALATYVDAEGLLRHDDADTWMDARIAGDQPWSPRGDRAVEIQALWIEALEVGQRLAQAEDDQDEARFFGRLALQARGAFDRRFVVQGILVDRVDAKGRADPRRRPNALMLAWINQTLPVDESVLEMTTRVLTKTLLLPWGILSLDPGHPDFHPRHMNPTGWHKDAAYHNGTIWGWNAGFTITALNRFGWQERSWQLTQNLTHQILEVGSVGTMSELVDALLSPGGEPVPSGTFSQAWSVSEFVRNAYQDYLGWHPNLPREEVLFRPALPEAWTEVHACLPYGLADESLQVHVTQSRDVEGLHQRWRVEGPTSMPRVIFEIPAAQGPRIRQVVATGPVAEIEFLLPPAKTDVPGFASWEPRPAGWSVEHGRDVLQTRILNYR